MPVTYVRAKTKEAKQREKLDSNDLQWLKSLRTIVLPAKQGSVTSKWKKMSPAACKLYVMIWALTSVDPIKTETGHILNKDVKLSTLEKLSGLTSDETHAAMLELRKSKLIKAKAGESICVAICYELETDTAAIK